MSSSITMYGRSLLLQLLFTPDEVANPGNCWLALCASVPGTSDDGTALDEPAGGYLRQQIALTSDNWAPTGYGEITSLADVTFPIFTVEQGLLQGWALADDPNAGQGSLIAVGSIANPYTASPAVQPIVYAGALTLGLYD